MDEEQIHETITRLVEQEHHLRGQSTRTEDQRTELSRVEESLDQCWDLLRQREALRAAGENPDEAEPRPTAEVEGYLQ